MASLSAEMGQEALFVGPVEHQLQAADIGSDDLIVVKDLASARRALHLIIVQGEGSSEQSELSHFEAFCRIRDEYQQLQTARASFQPSRNVAHNPVMRRPMVPDRVHVTGVEAAPLLDAANAVYSLMLRCLIAVYDTSTQEAKRRKALLGCAIGLMKLIAELSDQLTELLARANDDVRAGITFAMLRSTEGLVPGVDVALILKQRFMRIEDEIPRLALPEGKAADLLARLTTLRETLH